MDNFNLKKYLIENKLTPQSQKINEDKDLFKITQSDIDKFTNKPSAKSLEVGDTITPNMFRDYNGMMDLIDLSKTVSNSEIPIDQNTKADDVKLGELLLGVYLNLNNSALKNLKVKGFTSSTWKIEDVEKLFTLPYKSSSGDLKFPPSPNTVTLTSSGKTVKMPVNFLNLLLKPEFRIDPKYFIIKKSDDKGKRIN